MWESTFTLWLALVAALAAAARADSPEQFSAGVCAAAPDGSRAGASAIAAAVVSTLATIKEPAHAAPEWPCTIKALAEHRVQVALVAVPAAAALPALHLRELGIEELGDAAPAWRRACLASAPPARSLLDLARPALAAAYRLTPEQLHNVTQMYKCESKKCKFTPTWCEEANSTCATLLTSDESEVEVLRAVVQAHALRAEVVALGAALAAAARALAAARPVLACHPAPAAPLARLRARALGPPPCAAALCPFEPVRLVKFAYVRGLAWYPTTLRTLGFLQFTAEQLSNLTERARIDGPEEAARAYVAAQPPANVTGQPRVAVMVPQNTARYVYEAGSLTRAAELAERDTELIADVFTFKAQVVDDECSTSTAYRHLARVLGDGEYGALSAMAGPACGAAFADLARQAATYSLLMLAYTPQAPPPPPGAGLVLLAAGDARDTDHLWAAFLASMKWRRLAVLSELATRTSLDVTRFDLAEVTHTELPDDGDTHEELIAKWAKRAAEGNFKILYACLEDARAVRAALCAGHAAGLTAAGAAWLVPGGLPAGWTRAAPAERLACSPAQLAAAAAGHLRAAPAWLADPPPAPAAPPPTARAAWDQRCPRCVPHAALLYDTLMMWGEVLKKQLQDNPLSIDDFHNRNIIKSLIKNAVTANYTGLTGRFEWNLSNGVYIRETPLVIQQWRNNSYVTVGRWERGVLSLQREALRWETSDGRAPEDGGARCGLQALADVLRADCRTAFIVLAALLLAALLAVLAALALYCRRRAERDYRAHLEALRLRTYGIKPGGLDRWEVPRERVVINRKLGTGAFGTVYGGHALLAEDRGWTAVAVKTLKAGATTEEKLDFLSEAEAMKRFDHKNVVRLLAVVTKTEPVCTVMEFMLYGDLKNYLLARRHLATESGLGMGAGSDEAAEEVSPRRLTGMALDAARALSYLAQLRYVHRDVAARNCLVSAHRVVKLADFGMTRLVFENDYYRFSRKGMLPVRWMAPESLALGVFSPASDVWSFGVLLYEIVTFGSLPFQGLSNSEVLGRVKAGHTLELPSGLKPQLVGLIKSCWRQEAKARPQAAEVAAFLADSPRLLAPCLDVPLDALPLDPDPPWRAARDRAEARWVSWAAPASAATDTTYLSADAHPPSEADAFLPMPPSP